MAKEHNLLIRFNGGHGKDDKIDQLRITTFDGSTKERISASHF